MTHFYKVFGLCLSGVVLASCGETGSISPTLTRVPLAAVKIQSPRHEPPGDRYAVVSSFSDAYEGSYPNGGLLDVRGTLYGTTELGGTFGLGNVFSMSTAGAEKVLHSFSSVLDGSDPEGTLIDVNGTLYGMAPGDGVYNWGVVYSITTSGGESVLHDFRGGPTDGAEGQWPALVYADHKLYGMTSVGGATGRGTVFSVTAKGTEKVLHSFDGSPSDGGWPDGGLVYVQGLFYGTTTAGGTYYEYNDLGSGTIFSITPSGIEKIVFSFPLDGSDGCCLSAGLINVDGTLYGTTEFSGANGGGTAFSMTTSGSLTSLHSFGSGSDGSAPVGPLLDVNGMFYGTTSAGGAYGKGTVFSMSLTGNETVLHSFGYGSDGATPLAGLIDVKGKVYGTTSAGGAYNNGTVFALKVR